MCGINPDRMCAISPDHNTTQHNTTPEIFQHTLLLITPHKREHRETDRQIDRQTEERGQTESISQINQPKGRQTERHGGSSQESDHSLHAIF